MYLEAVTGELSVSVATSNQIAPALLEALGIDVTNVRKAVIILEAGEAAKIALECYLRALEGPQVELIPGSSVVAVVTLPSAPIEKVMKNLRLVTA